MSWFDIIKGSKKGVGTRYTGRKWVKEQERKRRRGDAEAEVLRDIRMPESYDVSFETEVLPTKEKPEETQPTKEQGKQRVIGDSLTGYRRIREIARRKKKRKRLKTTRGKAKE